MKDAALQKAAEIWDNGTQLGIHIDGIQNTLYSYKGRLYVFWYSDNNILKKIEQVDSVRARKIFPEYKKSNNREQGLYLPRAKKLKK